MGNFRKKPAGVTFKKDVNIAKIAGVRINITSKREVLGIIENAIAERRKIFVVTPNPEFIVFAHSHPWFLKILNSADLAVPDGVGLILAAKFLSFGGRQPTKKQNRQPLVSPAETAGDSDKDFSDKRHPSSIERVAGADLVAELMGKSDQRGWRVGIVGARRGDVSERNEFLRRLGQKYPGAKITALEDCPGERRKTIAGSWDIIFACQGMGKQEKWLAENKENIDGCLFMGVGGSLDYLAGFQIRAPLWMRSFGLEWLWRLIRRPAHFPRVVTALIVFPFLVLCKKLSRL